MAHINLTFGVKGGSSVASGTSGGAIKADIERICKQIEAQVTRSISIAPNKEQIAQVIETINSATKEIEPINIKVSETDFKRQIDSLVQYTKESFSNINVGISVNGNIGGTGGAATDSSGTGGAGGGTNTPRGASTSLNNNIQALKGVTQSVTTSTNGVTSITRAFRDASSGVSNTITTVIDAENKVMRTTTQSTTQIISDINKLEQRVKKADQTMRSLKNAGASGTEQSTDTSISNLNGEIATLRNNVSNNGINSEGAIDALDGVEAKVKNVEQAVKSVTKTYNTLDTLKQRINSATQTMGDHNVSNAEQLRKNLLEKITNLRGDITVDNIDSKKITKNLSAIENKVKTTEQAVKTLKNAWAELDKIDKKFNATKARYNEGKASASQVDKAVYEQAESSIKAYNNIKEQLTQDVNKVVAKYRNNNYNVDSYALSNVTADITALSESADQFAQKNKSIPKSIKEVEQALDNGKRAVEEYKKTIAQWNVDNKSTFINSTEADELNSYYDANSDKRKEIEKTLDKIKALQDKFSLKDDDNPFTSEDIDTINGEYSTLISQLTATTEHLNSLHATVEQGEKSYTKGVAAVERYRNSLASFEQAGVENKNTFGLHVNESDYEKVKNLKDSVEKQIGGIEATINRINAGETLDDSEMANFSNSVKAFLPNLASFISANSAMQGSISRSQQTLRSIQNTIIQNNKVYSEASYYHEKYRNSINANAEISAKWNSLLNKLQTGGFGNNYEAARMEVAQLQAETKKAGAETDNLFGKIKNLFSAHFGSQATVLAIGALVGLLPKAYQNVVAIDDAMVELKKVTDETNLSYEKFRESASATAKEVGATIADTVTSTADFARLGYSMEEASELARAALIYKNVGDGISDISEASESIISTMKAFGIEAEDAITIVDKFNIVGNNFAISSSGIGEALTRSASSLASAGNTLEESIALITAANSVIQDPDTVGTAMKTLSMYLRASKTEAEAAGIETDGMASSVSKLRTEIKQLTDVDIMLDNDTYKSTVQILREIAGVWDDLSDITQANLMEKLAGKRQGNVLSSILTNWGVAEEVLQTALNSDGSAVEENEKALDSITGKLTKLQAVFEDVSSSIVNDDLVKLGIDGLTNIISFFDDLGLTSTHNIAMAVASFALLNNHLGIFTKYVDEFGRTHNKVFNLENLFGKGNNVTQSARITNSYDLDISKSTQGLRQSLAQQNIFGYTERGLERIGLRINNNKKALMQFYTGAQSYVSGGGTFVDYLNSELNDTNGLLNKCDSSAKLFAANEDNFKALGTDVNNYSGALDRLYVTQQTGVAKSQKWTSTLGSFAANLGTTLLTAAASAGISLAISAAFTVIAEVIANTEKQMEEARTAADKLGESLDTLDDYAAEIESLNAVLSNNSSATEDVVSAKERLDEITEELCKQYGLERSEIDLTNGSLEEKLQLLRDIAQEEYKQNSRENYEGNKKTIDAMSKQSINLSSGDLLFHGINIDDLANTNPEMYYKTIEAFKNAGFTVEIEYQDSSGNAFFGDGGTGNLTAGEINTSLLNGSMKVNTIIDSVTADVYTLNNMLVSLYDSIKDLNNEAASSGYTNVTPVFDTMLTYFSNIFTNWLNNFLDGEDVLSQWIQYDDASPYAEYIPLLNAAKNKLDEAKKNKNISEIEAAQNEFNSLFSKIMSFEAGEGGKYTKLAQEWFNNTYGDTLNYTSPLQEATDKFVTSQPKQVIINSSGETIGISDKERKQREDFLNNLDYDDLQIAIQIDDLFDEGLDKAAEKIENFKQINLTFEFKYADYSEDMDKTLETAETIQTVLDSIANGEYNPNLDADTINELAEAFPSFAGEILAAQGDAEELEKVLKNILETTIQDMIDELPSLDGLSEENKAAVQGMLDMLEALKTGSITKLKEYANSLDYTQKLIERLKIADELRDILKSDSKSIPQELLSSIQSAYPELNRYIQNYLADGSEKNAEALINAYLNAYNEDRTNFFNYIKDKDKEWTKSEWQEFLDDNADWVDDFNKAYEINLRDYESYLDAMDALTKKHEDGFEEYYKKAVGEGYIPTSVREDLRKRFDTETSNSIDEFLLETQRHREEGSLEDNQTLSEKFEEEMRIPTHLYNQGLMSHEDYLNALEAANEKYYKNSEEHLDDYLSNKETIYNGRQEIYKEENDKLIEDLDNQYKRGEITSKEYIEKKTNYRDSMYGIGSPYYGTKFATDAYEDLDDDIIDESYNQHEEEANKLIENLERDFEKGIITAEEFCSRMIDIRDTYYGESSKYYGTKFAEDNYIELTDKISGTSEDVFDEAMKKWDDEHGYSESGSNSIALRTARNEYRKELANNTYGDESSDLYNPKKLKEELDDIKQEDDEIWEDKVEQEKSYWTALKEESEDYYDEEISKLESIADEEERINKEEELRNKLIKARKELLEAQGNRNQLIFKDGNFTYDVDQEVLLEAQEDVKEAEDELAEQQRQTQIDLLKEEKETVSKFYQDVIDRLDEYSNYLSGEETPTESDDEVLTKAYRETGGDINYNEQTAVDNAPKIIAADTASKSEDSASSSSNNAAKTDDVMITPVLSSSGKVTDKELSSLLSSGLDDNAILEAIHQETVKQHKAFVNTITTMAEAEVESASTLHPQLDVGESSKVSNDNSVTIGDIRIAVQGGTSIEMLKEFSEKIGGYIQQYTTQTNYAKK